MPRESPAVVQRPHNLFVGLFEIIEKYFNIKVITVKVVKMNNVGVIFLDERNQLFCSSRGVESFVIEKPCL